MYKVQLNEDPATLKCDLLHKVQLNEFLGSMVSMGKNATEGAT